MNDKPPWFPGKCSSKSLLFEASSSTRSPKDYGDGYNFLIKQDLCSS